MTALSQKDGGEKENKDGKADQTNTCEVSRVWELEDELEGENIGLLLTMHDTTGLVRSVRKCCCLCSDFHSHLVVRWSYLGILHVIHL